MIRALLAWFDDRTGAKAILHEALYERIPGGARWRYVWGSTLCFTFAIQVITGIFLWTAYSPSAQTAWESVYYIQEKMFLGDIVRGIHHFAAQAMTVLLAVHLIQVIIDGAYKAPREINFWLGLILMKIVLALGLTGYLLPWDQKGYYATQVTTNIMGATPVIGQQVQELAQGAPHYGHHTLTRFFAMHAGILPGALIAFLGLHLYVFRRHGIHAKDVNHAPETTFWPDQVLKDAVACLGVLAVVLLLAIFKGAELSPPASTEAYEAARPEWYFLFLFRFLKFKIIGSMGLAVGAIIIPGILFGVLVAMPIIARASWGHKFNVRFTWTMMVIIFLMTTLAFVEDATNDNHQMAIAEAHREAARAKELAEGDLKIPVEGAAAMLRDDPFTQGPRVFDKYCKSCHRWDGHSGRGRLVTSPDPNDDSKTIVSHPVATDLSNIRTREWLRAIIMDYGNHFGDLRNAKWYTENPGIDLDDGEMAGSSQVYAEHFGKEQNKKDRDALIEYLYSLGGRDDVKEELLERGAELVDGGVLSDGTDIGDDGLAISCSSCHSDVEKEFDPDSMGEGYPTLSGYMSKAWLKAFIRNPEGFYGDSNRMPAYTDMPEKELDLLVRWMLGDYRTEVEDYPSRKDELPKKKASTATDEGGGE